MASRTLRVDIVGDASKARKAFSDASTGADGLSGKLDAAGKKLQGLGKSLTTHVTLPIVGALGLSTKAAMDDEASAGKLAHTMQKTTGATQDQIASVEDWILKTSLASGVADDKLRPALQNLLIATKDSGKAQSEMGLAMDIATTKGLDVEAVTKAMAKAHGGNTGALGKLGIATKDASGQALTYDQIMQNAQKTFGGATAKHAATGAGGMERMRVSMAEAGESIGAVLLPFLAQAGEWIGKLAKWIGGLDGPTKTWIVGIGLVLAALGPVIGLLGTLGTVLGFIAANPIVLIIAAIAAIGVALYMLYQKSEAFRAFVDSAWQFIQQAIASAVDALRPVFDAFIAVIHDVWDVIIGIKDFIVGVFTGDWQQAWNGIKEIFAGVWNLIIDYFKYVWEVIKLVATAAWNVVIAGLSAAWNWVSGVFSSVWGGIVDFFSFIWDVLKGAVSGGLDFIKGIISDVMGGISTVWNKAWDGLTTVVAGVRDTVIDIWNGIKSVFKDGWNWIADKWNGSIGSIHFSIPDWVPGVGGDGFDMPDLPKLASGGIVMPSAGGTHAIIGEGGAPEAVLPLTPQFLGQLGGGGGVTVNVTVTGSLVHERELGATIQRVLLDLKRRDGTLAFV